MIKCINGRGMSINLNTRKPPTGQENIVKSAKQQPENKMVEKPDNILLVNKKNVVVNQNSSNQSIVGKLLDEIAKKSKLKNKIDHHQLNFQEHLLFQSKIDINIAKDNKLNNRFIEPIEIEVSSTMDIDLIYEIDYGQELEKCIFNNQVSYVIIVNITL